MTQPKMLAELILELCGALHRNGNVPVLMHAPSSGGRGPVSVLRVQEDLQVKDGAVVAITDGAEL